MRRLISIMLLLLAPVSGLLADNIFNNGNNVYLNNDTAYIGKQFVLPVKMKNSVEFVAYQMDLYLPTGVTVATYGEQMTITGARMTASHVMESSVMSDGAIRLLCYSNDNSTLTGNDGAIAYITLNSTVTEECSLPITIRNVRLASLDGTNDYVSAEDISCSLSFAHEIFLASSVTLDRTSVSGYPGDTFQLTATLLPDNASNKTIAWNSSDNAVATVSQSGLVTLVGGGYAVVYATTTDGTDLSAECAISCTTGNIAFADDNVKAICVSNWDIDNNGQLSYEEAAIVTSLGNVFQNRTGITSFCELRYFTGLTSIPQGSFQGCNNLLAVEWNNASVKVPSDIMSHPNGMLYISQGVQSDYSGNTVTEGWADNITLTFGQSLYIPNEFKAGYISLSRSFDKLTYLGVSAGWEAMVLPYDVDCVMHESKGEISPFISGVNPTGVHRFWLGGLVQDGNFERKASIKANVPFIISMPNSDAYSPEFNLNGKVTFIARNAVVHSTVSASSVTGASFTLIPTYTRVEPSDMVYPLNDTSYNGYYAGGVFVHNSRPVQPFESYISPLSPASAAPFFAIGDNGTTSIRNMSVDLKTGLQQTMYNIYGLPVNDSYHGIVIQNGVKFIK